MIARRTARPIPAMFACVASALAGSAAAAQDGFPAKPIKLIVPLAAGGGIDFTARTAAQKLSDVLGQQVVVENQGGAGGVLGVNAVARAAPDGYTLLYHSVSGVVSSVVGKDLPYDWLRDLAPVSLVTRFAPVLIINPSLPAGDLKEFIALAKANPGKFSYGSSGAGTAIHLASELFKAAAGVDIVHVPYRGNAGVMPDLLAGRIAMLIDGVPAQAKNIDSGLVRALAVTTRTRSAALPERADHDGAGGRLRGPVLDGDLRPGRDAQADSRQARRGHRQGDEGPRRGVAAEGGGHRGRRIDAAGARHLQPGSIRALPRDRRRPEAQAQSAIDRTRGERLAGHAERGAAYFSRSQITITRTTLLFWLGCGMGGLSMNSRSPSKRMNRVCSPPTQPSFQAASTLVTTLPSSTR